MNERYKVLFDMNRVSFNTILCFSEIQGPGNTLSQVKALNSLIRDCLWDTAKNAYTTNEEDIDKFIRTITLKDAEVIVDSIASQIQLGNDLKSMINKDKDSK